MALKVVTGILIMVVYLHETQSSSKTMKMLTTGFMKVLDTCKEELNISEGVLSDLYHYWKEDYDLMKRDTGCVIVCMSRKLDLLDDSGKIHHGNTADFAKKHGAAEETASQIVSLLHECEKTQDHVEDPCIKALEVAKCFRIGIHKLNWTPKMDVLVTEVLTDI
uniref:Pheromone binding protein 2 n=1 Tax=Phauda flammans TaxID=2720869 RepID=A0A6M6R985_9NEOP|nr:pheromone binding protein 2 [Phauda flammans]